MLSTRSGYYYWKVAKRVFLYCSVYLITTIVLFPLYWVVVSSLKTRGELFARVTLIPQQITVMNFVHLFTISGFHLFLRNSLIIALTVTLVVVSVAALAAYGIDRFRFRGRRTFVRLILTTYMFPLILLAIPIYTALGKMGLTNTFTGVILAQISYDLPFCTWLLWNFVKTVPLELEEASMIDGASRSQTFRWVVFPLMRPGIIAAGIFAFLWSWSDFVYPMILLSSDSKRTASLAVASFVGSLAIEWEYLLAGSVVLILPVIILFMYVAKYLVLGFGGGAVKE